MTRLLCALLLPALCGVEGPAPLQDPAKIRDLAGKLEDEAFDVREQAQADLVKLGEGALPELRRILGESKDRAELRLRLEAAIRDIDLAAKARSVCPDPKLVTLKVDGSLEKVAEAFLKASGVRLETGAVDASATFSLDLDGVPLLMALDELCRGSEGRRWEFVDEDRVRLLREPTPAWPTSYSGAFRTRITAMRHARSTDFRAKTATLRLVLEADCERRVKPSRGVDIDLQKAEDDKGSAIEIRKGDDDDEGMVMGRGGIRVNRMNVRMWAAGGGANPEGPPGETLTLKGIDPAATKLKLQGTATFRFPLDRSELRFAPPTSGETRDASDLKLRLDVQGGARWKLTVSKAKPEAASPSMVEEVQQRLDMDSLVAVDEEGGEHKGSFQPSGDTVAAQIVVVNGVVQQSVSSVGYQLQFPSGRGKSMKEIRFKFADRILEKKIPFAFEGVPLP